MKYRCTVCGHIYDEEKEHIKFVDLPEDSAIKQAIKAIAEKIGF